MIGVEDITKDDFKAWFRRDFTYATPIGTDIVIDTSSSNVFDEDIDDAYSEAKINFNPALFSDDNELRVSFLYLSAHYLVTKMQSSEQGLNSTGYLPVASRTVGSVSESYAVPEWMLSDPVMSQFMTTRYGQKYLALIKGLAIGNVAVYEGGTTYR